jgi:hypothetical protein
MYFDEIMKVLASFEREGLEYVVVGGVAVNLHGIPRATQDLDVFIRPDAANVERLKTALRGVYDDPDIDEISAEDLLGDYPAVRYHPPTGALFLDILTQLGEFARYEDLGYEEADIDGIRVRLATPKTLYWLKEGTIRFVDRADAAALKEKFQIAEEDAS